LRKTKKEKKMKETQRKRQRKRLEDTATEPDKESERVTERGRDRERERESERKREFVYERQREMCDMPSTKAHIAKFIATFIRGTNTIHLRWLTVLQNIVSFIGLFCKRDLQLRGANKTHLKCATCLTCIGMWGD